MRLVIVGISDLKVSADPDVALITYGLGSCIALTAWDPGRRIGGMIHFMLPTAALSAEKATEQPAMFADSGVPLLFERMTAQGCRLGGLQLRAVGGASRLASGSSFDIGRRNYVALRKLLWRAGLILSAEAVGGTKSRTVRLEVDSGRVLVRSDGEEWAL